MANQIQPAARSKKIGSVAAPAQSARPRLHSGDLGHLGKKSSEARPRRGTVEIGSGVRVRCHELSADLAFIRFDCGARPTAPGTAGGRRTGRPSGAS
jgi:hypothetical protein